jgi:DNA-directed RNA polymerase specialized sigma24 family protein
MFEDLTDLSSDLEWMLLSGQVDDDTLIQVLVRQYYQRVYDLAFSWLTNPDQAHYAVQETFVQAIFHAKNYHLEMKVDDLLEGMLSEIVL